MAINERTFTVIKAWAALHARLFGKIFQEAGTGIKIYFSMDLSLRI